MATTLIYTLSLHDALPIFPLTLSRRHWRRPSSDRVQPLKAAPSSGADDDRASRSVVDRKSTRLNSSHLGISYAVFCLKKKKERSGKNPSLTCLVYDHDGIC